MRNINPKIIIIGLVIIILILIIAVRAWSLRPQEAPRAADDGISRIPTPTSVEIISSQGRTPFKPAAEIPVGDRGADLSDEAVQQSQQEIAKLLQILPYEELITTQAGVPVEIYISREITAEHPWYVSVDMYGIDFEVPPGTAEEAIMRNAFLESVNTVTTWMKQRNINPSNLYIEWGGEKAFTQNQAERWLTQ